MSNPAKKFKIEANAGQLYLTGVVVLQGCQRGSSGRGESETREATRPWVTSLVGRKRGKDGTLESHLCQISWASVSLFTEVEEPKMWFLGLLQLLLMSER